MDGGTFTLQFRELEQQIQNQKNGERGIFLHVKTFNDTDIIYVKNNYILPCYK